MEVSVLQWNVWYQQGIHDVASLLKEYSPDIICLQELTLHYDRQTEDNTPEYLAAQLDYVLYYQTYPMAGGVLGANAILSRFPITQSRFVWTQEPDGSGTETDEFRLYIEVEVALNGTSLWVGTTHMHYTHRFRGDSGKRCETTQLVQQLGRHQSKFVFTGDLNALPRSQTLQSIRAKLRHMGPDYHQKTWATKPFYYNGFSANELNWRLDYIFATRDVYPLESTIIKTEFSDHLPILARLEA